MTDDTHDETSPDAALADPVFDELFSALREVGCRPAPQAQPALAALLSGAAVGRRRRRVRGATAGLAVVGVLAGGVGAAAATGHLQQPPAVARVDHRPSEIAVTGEPVEHPTPVGVPPGTRVTPTARPAPADPGDSAGTRPDAGPDPELPRPRSGASPASQGPTSDEGPDDEGTVETPEPQESGDDHADDDGGEGSGETDGAWGEDAEVRAG